MIIRRLPSSDQLISQPEHARLATRIMREWDSEHFPESPRRASILASIEHHDDGWTEIDETLVVDADGRLLDFVALDDTLKRDTSLRGIEELASDPYAAALVAQHRVHVYRRLAGKPGWDAFFVAVTTARDGFTRAAGVSLDEVLRDYRLLRAGDLASLAFCNNTPSVSADECGYAMRLDGASLVITPDPLGGRVIEFEIGAREIPRRLFASAEDARGAMASAQVVTLRGSVRGE